MAGTPPNGKSWISSSWRDYVLQLADDVQQLQQYKPLFELAARDTSGGSGPSSRTFLARIISDTGLGHTNGCNYVAVEVVGPRSPLSQIEISQIPGDDSTNAQYFWASNTYEEGLECGKNIDDEIWIPPAGALSTVDGQGCFRGLTCNALPIAFGSIVTMHAMNCITERPKGDDDVGKESPCECVETDRILGEGTIYWFSAVVQPCLGCEDPNPGPEPLTPPEAFDLPVPKVLENYNPFSPKINY